ncbi:family 43 glycosylhydrolase [Streptomyces sp. NPDC048272]|uniref:family 43 glycosylhydrolase n=1 Tax=Streptomyces sp. NPDC048272 TaxID=3154616 RepID=UPI003437CF32
MPGTLPYARVLAAVAALLTGGVLPQPAHARSAPPAPAAHTNPLAERRADAQIHRHTDGYYYFTATVPEYDRIVLRRAATLQGLSTAPETVIWTKHATGEMGAHIWAPEIHFIDGKWYVYFAAGRSDDIWKVRMYVLESSAANPLTGGWTEKGRIATPMDSFALDATTFVVGGIRYLSWAQKDPAVATNSNVYVARLANPWTISGTPTRLTVPTHPWETVGFKVNEAPALVEHAGRVFLSYSASATDSNYCLGLLSASASSNLLDPAAWTKSPTPVLTSNTATGQYGPGHNSFTKTEDGTSDVLVYHDRGYKDISGDPLDDPNRRTRIQKLYWNADGSPNFGIPVADGATPYRLASVNHPDRYVRHQEFRGRLDADVRNLADSQFRTVPGLAGGGTVSLESANLPGSYLRESNGEVRLERDDGSAAFKSSATFRQRTGLSDAAWVSYESYSAPGRFLRHRDFLLYVEPAATALAKADATFRLE